MSQNQKTIQKEFSLEGTGLHTGHKVKVTFKPAGVNSGISFIRVDLPGKPVIKADITNVLIDKKIPRCTSIGNDKATIHTSEHLMSVLCGLGIDNLTVEINGNEVPGLDGSGLDFLNAIKQSGMLEQNAPREYFIVREPIWVERNGSSIFVVPSTNFEVSYVLDYRHPHLPSQFLNVTVSPEIFEKEIAPCRTFCLESEAEELRKNGLGKGANYTNTLVIGENGVKENKLRFKDEFTRHKILDFIGDLYLLGMPIKGKVMAVKSGHTLNLELLKKISAQKSKYESRQADVSYDFSAATEIDISGIMKILPHRYPFLLVDRVIKLEKGKRAVGIKNVTINDNFFEGHFPSRPIMPGVLMVEAMAQTGGVAVLTDEQHKGKLAFFLSADNVKFRKVVTPGDQLMIEVEVLKSKSKIAQVQAIAKVNNEIVAEADMTFSFIEGDYLT